MQHVIGRMLVYSQLVWGFAGCGVEERDRRSPVPSISEALSTEFAINHWKVDQPLSVDGTIAAIYPNTHFHGIYWTALLLEDVSVEDSVFESQLWALFCPKDCKKAPAIPLDGLELGQQVSLIGSLHEKKNILLPLESLTVVTEDTHPPSIPTGLTAVELADGSVSLSWEPSFDGAEESGLSHYIVWRDQVEMAQAGFAQHEYTDLQVQPATEYTYTVQAVDHSGNVSLASDPVVVATRVLTPLPEDIQPPSVPNGFVAVAHGSDSIILSWEFSHDDLAVAGYQVFRDGVLISETPADSPAYMDFDLAPSTEYSYEVSAFDEAGNLSERTAPVTARTADPATEL